MGRGERTGEREHNTGTLCSKYATMHAFSLHLITPTALLLLKVRYMLTPANAFRAVLLPMANRQRLKERRIIPFPVVPSLFLSCQWQAMPWDSKDTHTPTGERRQTGIL